MRKPLNVLLVLFVFGALLLAACGGGGEAEKPAVPSDYAGKTNPLASDANAVSAGKTIYDERCASCHGATGAGDGPAAAGLDPKPAALSSVVGAEGEDYLFWRISEGGANAPFNSSMPAQKGILTEEQIWQVVSYIKSFSS